MRWTLSLVALVAIAALGCSGGDCAPVGRYPGDCLAKWRRAHGDIVRLHVDALGRRRSNGHARHRRRPEPAPQAERLGVHSASGPAAVVDVRGLADGAGASTRQRQLDRDRLEYDAGRREGLQSDDDALWRRCPIHRAGDMAAPPGSRSCRRRAAGSRGLRGRAPDEDSDGRANCCDLCPADHDPTPVDTDGDGLPDACDPDPGTKTTRCVFRAVRHRPAATGRANAVAQSYITIDPADRRQHVGQQLHRHAAAQRAACRPSSTHGGSTATVSGHRDFRRQQCQPSGRSAASSARSYQRAAAGHALIVYQRWRPGTGGARLPHSRNCVPAPTAQHRDPA